MEPSHPPARARLVTIGPEQAGQRLDNFLSACFRSVPRSRIYRSLRSGEVRVNKGRARQTYRLREGDRVRLPPLTPGTDGERRSSEDTASLARRGRELEPLVLFEDPHVLLLDKPAGWPVHAGSGRAFGIIECLRACRGESRFLELVHRLDQHTSGALLLAKRRSALTELHRQLREEQVDKRYRVLLKGKWRGGGRRVDAPLRRGQDRSGERIVRIDRAGQPAVTAFTPIAVSPRASLMEAHPLSGRTHQIRVHAARALDMPVAGDPRYGDRAFNRALRALGHSRMFLHAYRIGFRHPHSGDALRIVAPLPESLRAMLDAFDLCDDARAESHA